MKKFLLSCLLALSLHADPTLICSDINHIAFLSWPGGDPTALAWEVYVEYTPSANDKKTQGYQTWDFLLGQGVTNFQFDTINRGNYYFHVRPIYDIGYGAWLNVVSVRINK